MEQLTSQLHLFYTQPLPAQQRQEIHNNLLTTLTSSHYQALAQQYLTRPGPTDPYLLFHILTILDHSPTAEPLLQILLSHVPNTPRETLNKAALVTAHHGLVLWSHNPEHPFLAEVLRLLQHNGHTPDATRIIITGVVLLTSIIECLTQKQRLLHTARITLRDHVRQRSKDILSGLEIGARLAGPAFPTGVTQAAVRALAALVTLSPHVVEDVLGVLIRCIEGRFDDTGAEILSVIIDILGGRVVEVSPVAGIVARLLEAVAMGDDVDDSFSGRLMALVEITVRRCASVGVNLERVLNGLMGVTALWAQQKPGWFIGALDCWISILDTFEDIELRGDLVEKVYNALAKICVEKCMMHSVLEQLEEGDEVIVEHGWDEVGDIAAVATDPVSLSGCMFIKIGLGDPEGFDALCTREDYVNKCVETLLTIARLSPAVAIEAAKFTITKLTSGLPEDVTIAALIAFGLAQIHPTAELLQRVYELLTAGLWQQPKLGVALLRTAAALVGLLEDAPDETIRNVGGRLLTISQQAMTSSSDIQIVYAGAVLLLSLDASFRKQLFQSPPLPCSIILTTRYPAIAALGVSSTLHWALFPMKGANGLPEKWDADEWESRINTANKMLKPVFAPSGGMIGITRYACLVDVVMDITYGAYGKTVSAVWNAFSREAVEVLRATIGELCDGLAGSKSADEGKEIGDVLARVVRALSTVKKVHGISGGNGVVVKILPYAEVSEMLTEACLGVVRGLVDEERYLKDGLSLARTAVMKGGGVGELAIGVLLEATNHSFDGVLGILEGVRSDDIGICRVALQALQKLHVSRRVFGMQEFVPVREVCVRECLKIIGLVPGREGLGEEAVEVLWEIRESCSGVVEGLVKEIGDCGEWVGRNGFGIGVRRAVDDFLVRNQAVSL